jgi:hypothetical protein
LGTRFAGSQLQKFRYFWQRTANKFATFLSNTFTGLNLTDIQTGHKAFRASLLSSVTIAESRFGVDAELIAKFARLRCRIKGGRNHIQRKKLRGGEESTVERWRARALRDFEIWRARPRTVSHARLAATERRVLQV